MMNANVRRAVARGCELLIGLFFVAGAIPKAMDINRFSVQVSAYHVVTDKAYLPWFALATLFAEMALGAALLLGLRLRGITILALELMLAVFTVLIIYAWVFYGLEDCGCFPLLKMSPPVSIAKNVVLFLFGLVAWRVLVHKSAAGEAAMDVCADSAGSACSWKGAAVRFVIAFLAAAAALGYAALRVEHIAVTPPANNGSGGEAGIDYAQFVFMTDMGSYDLGKGVYLVPILSMTCEDCMGKVPLLNDLLSQPGMPPMVALCYEDKPGDLDNFKGQTQPMFPLHPLGDQPLLYFNLRGKDPFRLTLVRNGRALIHWDEKVPTVQEVAEALEPAASPAQ